VKYRFGTREWLAALHAIICERARTAAATHPDYSYSICEVYTGVPADIALLHGGRTAWHAAVRGAEVTFELEESDAVDFKAVVDYASVIPLGQFDTMGRADRAAKLQEMSQAVVAGGKLKMTGTPPGGDGPLGSLHDAIAKLTA
jgi:hypothetical protein